MPRLEDEPTHSRIYSNVDNGALRPKFAGVTDENYFDSEKQIYIPIEEMPTSGQTQ